MATGRRPVPARCEEFRTDLTALGNQYFRFYDVRIAEAVTRAGQLSIRWIETRMNEYLIIAWQRVGVDFVSNAGVGVSEAGG